MKYGLRLLAERKASKHCHDIRNSKKIFRNYDVSHHETEKKNYQGRNSRRKRNHELNIYPRLLRRRDRIKPALIAAEILSRFFIGKDCSEEQDGKCYGKEAVRF